MCGIIGCASKTKSVIYETMRGLIALHNRGSASSGIFGYNSEEDSFNFEMKKPKAAPILYDTEVLKWAKDVPSNFSVGHNRYPTSGSNPRRDMQPIKISQPGIVGAHNGQVANLISLKETFESLGWHFDTECDVEYLLFSLAENLRRKGFNNRQNEGEFFYERLVPAVREMMTEGSPFYINGAYSFITIIAPYGIVAIRDPYGFRPLVMAEKHTLDDRIITIASEDTVFNYTPQYYNKRFIQNGEVVFVDKNLNIYSRIVLQKPKKFCSFEYYYFAQKDSDLEGKVVGTFRKDIGRIMAEYFFELKDNYDIVMPVPETSRFAAQQMAKSWGKEYDEGITVRREAVLRTFLQPTQEEIDMALVDKFMYDSEAINGKRIALIDDSNVRGSTQRKIIRFLRDRGAREIHSFFMFDKIFYPCIYGIDTPQKERLIAYRHSGDEIKIAAEIGADSVHYLPISAISKVPGINKDELCFACLDGNYPTGDYAVNEYTRCRVKERSKMK